MAYFINLRLFRQLKDFHFTEEKSLSPGDSALSHAPDTLRLSQFVAEAYN